MDNPFLEKKTGQFDAGILVNLVKVAYFFAIASVRDTINVKLKENGTVDNDKNQYQGNTVNELMAHWRLMNGGLLMRTVKTSGYC